MVHESAYSQPMNKCVNVASDVGNLEKEILRTCELALLGGRV